MARRVEPNGRTTEYDYDDDCNCVAETHSDGQRKQYAYDVLGRLTYELASDGSETRFVYDYCGNLIRVVYADGSQRNMSYNGVGDLVYMQTPAGPSYSAQYLLHRVFRLEFPNARSRQCLYDLEIRLTEILDEADGSNRFERNDDGVVTRVIWSDGQRRDFIRDAMNRLVRYVDGNGAATSYSRDALGNITRIEYDDGTSATFQYNARSELVSAENDAGRWQYDLNLAGLVTRSEQQGRHVYLRQWRSGG